MGALGIMSAYNRIGAVWTGGSYPLMQTVLRGEWGFEGFVISDFNLYPYMSPNQSIYAGTDLTLTFAPSKSFEDSTSPAALHDMRQAAHNILYVVAHSNAMNGVAPGAIAHYTPPTWVVIQWSATAALGVLILGGAFLVTRRVMKHKAVPVAVPAVELVTEPELVGADA
jgi:beta-glucosidase